MPPALKNLLDSLPDAFRERARWLSGDSLHDSGQFVLYWMSTAARVDENPALDFAIITANQLQLPVLVYHPLSQRYPYASDRHHTFILQGARDVQATIGERNVAYAFHLERPEQRGPHLKVLAERAALVVTEEMPVAPSRTWTRALRRNTRTPVFAIDTACVVPMQLVGQAYERAFAYRDATKQLYEERLMRKSQHSVAKISPAWPDDLPFEPLDLQDIELDTLVAQCEIDHSIGPVPDTIGGSNAGYVRWQEFKEKKLSRYAKVRNNPLADGVSRLSAYLHYGMVSPQRLAREAAAIGNDGAEKFLDELLIWRELAYAFCYHRPEHDTVSALPEWAIQTLAEHESDRRPALFSWERLARGCTQDLLWDAAQKSLLIHGELHNNVRMTWGKAILNWTEDAKQALATMIDLNHRYALDGRDPASYGGILWCLGQFDRPFPPARPIFGTVRDRSTAQHSQRLDPQAYARHTARPSYATSPAVAVIGAGISGLMCARTLQDHGMKVSVFEKSRGPGGRMSTRRTDEGFQFDHGAQYFTARDERFRRYVDSWRHDGIVAPWNGRMVVLEAGKVTAEKHGTDRYVAVPGMNSICRHLASDLEVHFSSKVTAPKRIGDQWQLTDDAGGELGSFDSVIVSAPAAQTVELLAEVSGLSDQAKLAKMSGCWAVMLALAETLQHPFDGAFVHGSSLSWIARSSNRPGRSPLPETWVLHASPEWSESNIERSPADVEAELLTEFWRVIDSPAKQVRYSTAHRWRFALPTMPLESRCLFDNEVQIGACGDWCGGPRVEGAFLSGAAAAGRILGLFNRSRLPAAPGGQHQGMLF